MPRILPLLIALVGVVTGCSDPDVPPPVAGRAALPPEPRPSADTRILSVDGIDFTYGEVQPYVEFFDRLYPKWTLAAKVRRTLEVYLVPLRFAERDFAAERRAALQHAQGLVSVAGNVVELAEKGGPTAVRKTLIVPLLELPLALFLFDRSKIGSTSPPIPLPQGFSVVGAFDVTDGAVVSDDLVDAEQVTFFTHQKDDFDKWLTQLRVRLADKVTYVHPDFRNATPDWLKLP